MRRTTKEDLEACVSNLNTLLEFREIDKVFEVGYRNGYVYLDRIDPNDRSLQLGVDLVCNTKKEMFTHVSLMCKVLNSIS